MLISDLHARTISLRLAVNAAARSEDDLIVGGNTSGTDGKSGGTYGLLSSLARDEEIFATVALPLAVARQRPRDWLLNFFSGHSPTHRTSLEVGICHPSRCFRSTKWGRTPIGVLFRGARDQRHEWTVRPIKQRFVQSSSASHCRPIPLNRSTGVAQHLIVNVVSELLGKTHPRGFTAAASDGSNMTHQKLTAKFPTESVAKICRRWQRRYKRKGFGRILGKREERKRHARAADSN